MHLSVRWPWPGRKRTKGRTNLHGGSRNGLYLDSGIPYSRSFGMGMLGSSSRSCLSFFAAGVTASTTCDFILVPDLP